MRWLPVLAIVGLLTPVARAAASPDMLMEVWIGDRTDNQIVPLTVQDDKLLMAAADFQALKLTLPANARDGKVDLMHLKGLSAHIDQTNQRLRLEVDTAVLPRQDFDLRSSEDPPEAQGDTGAILHYSLSGTANNLAKMGRNVSGGGDFWLEVFTPLALLRNNAFVTGGSGGWQAVRLDTSLIHDNPGKLAHFTFGDAISATPDWGRAVRFAGIEYASDFSLRPGLVTQPLPSFFGQSAVPATVDVFNGAVQVYQQPVGAGPFTLHNLPVVTGGGTATIVTTDVLGRQTSQTISLFTDQGMLAPGLDDYAFDAGFLRRKYGQTSFAYDSPMASVNWRRGLTDFLTLQTHGEASPKLGLLGAGGEFGFGVGSLSADFATSESAAGHGNLVSASIQTMVGDFSLFVRAMLATPSYRDLASLDHDFAPPRQRYQLGANMNLHAYGVLGINWLESKNAKDDSHQFLTSSWSGTLANGMIASLTGFRDFRSRSFGLQLFLSMPLDGTAMAGTTADITDGRASGQAVYTNPANPDGGIGYRALAGSELGGHFLGNVDYIGRSVGLNGGIGVQDSQVGVQGNAEGALVLLRGSVFTAHDPGNAVALVETGEKNVRVYLENREIARSDENGRVLLTGLSPYGANHISIDPRDYPFETVVEKTDMVVAPRRHSGVVASFVPPADTSVAVQIVSAEGVMPLGAKVTLDGDAVPIMVGHDGRVMMANLKEPRSATVTTKDKQCRIYIPGGESAETAPLLCMRGVVADAH